MKKVFKLEGLNCAHCAAKIEEKVSKLEGVKSVVINFMTTKMTLESIDDNIEEIIENVKKLINEVEPDVNMVKA
ncbi:heavy metal-associated domain-containing protein [Fusobacterium polymorphum]|uniref:heavy metal-associated domain-containing protein n=1 Tax=Fusobacterium nucleatum subsp. polymorphum TaxID=76857 RepID=UPI00300A1C6C